MSLAYNMRTWQDSSPKSKSIFSNYLFILHLYNTSPENKTTMMPAVPTRHANHGDQRS